MPILEVRILQQKFYVQRCVHHVICGNNYPKLQHYTVYLYLYTAQHISGGISTHHQELITLYLQHLVLTRQLLQPVVNVNNQLYLQHLVLTRPLLQPVVNVTSQLYLQHLVLMRPLLQPVVNVTSQLYLQHLVLTRPLLQPVVNVTSHVHDRFQ